MDAPHAALIVIDMQNGFLNAHSQHILPTVTGLIDRWAAAGRPVVFTQYRNHPGSPFERLLHWTRLQQPPETDIAPTLAQRAAHARAVIDKPAYTCFTAQGSALFEKEGWSDLVFCGIATENCVLKSAVDAFERGYRPWIVTDASASHAGSAVHEAGVTVARRFIGADHLITSGDLPQMLK
ncbi:isochorismatase family cysteine hydrolase [Streptomyces gobiensis]|uniref:isochorismatase family cysteine hydrolase n=1 Tax=Streptomyces gobiensis TaxID=2875706 RepID=UPI001E3D6FAC|nr:isochorismatase family cysteine hydrolase [Streptomyces gobiensis]UGY92955.1 cysteine hydrolase [Streptomyces gobiensis]